MVILVQYGRANFQNPVGSRDFTSIEQSIVERRLKAYLHSSCDPTADRDPLGGKPAALLRN